MKFRRGFVSNSSSTCFIVSVPSENKALLNRNWVVSEFEYYYPDQINRFSRSELLEDGYYLVEKSDNYEIYQNDKLPILYPWQGGRSTAIAYGEDLNRYIQYLQDEDYTSLAQTIKDIIQVYGLENILFMRESDEGMGGYLPQELSELSEKAIIKFDYH